MIPGLQKYQTDHLLILVGSNPLPNYVAIKLLSRPDTKIWMVYTSQVKTIADRICAVLEMSNRTKFIEVSESESDNIYSTIAKNIATEPQGSWGLHYTGGTKAMAIHAYRALEAAKSEAVFSYLDAGTLELIIERPQANAIRFWVEQEVTPTLEALALLHQFEIRDPGTQIPLRPDLAFEMAQVFTRAAEQTTAKNDEIKNVRKAIKDAVFKPKEPLPQKCGSQSMETIWGQNTTIADLAASWGISQNAHVVSEWIMGKWLEHYILAAIQQNLPSLRVQESRLGLILREQTNPTVSFELDVCALQGYQLFVFSCSTGYDKARLKLKLFEAYTRARQIGGDEARVALVCCARPYHPRDNLYGHPQLIQAEAEEDWDAPQRIRVFGIEHLLDLPLHVQEWFLAS